MTIELSGPQRRCTPHGRRPKLHKRADGKQVITGYAAVFYDRANPAGTQYPLWEGVVERIMPGAFDVVLKNGGDTRATFNHSANVLLGRSTKGTLRLSVDAVGLLYECDPPDTQAARDLIQNLDREDVDGSSFMFSVRGDGGRVVWAEEGVGTESYLEVREIHSISELLDVGPVTYPAYSGTTAGTRDRELLEAELRSIKAERSKALGADDALAAEIAMRLRLIEIG